MRKFLKSKCVSTSTMGTSTMIASKKGAVNLSTLLMVVSFLAIVGFLYWLSSVAESTEAEVEPDAPEEVLNEVPLSVFSAGRVEYVGQEVTLRGLLVEDATSLAPHFFWTNLSPGAAMQNNYLINVTQQLLDDSLVVANGSSVDVTGMVREMSDSLLDVWETAGIFGQETDRMVVSFAENFIEARALTVITDGMESDNEGDGSDSEPSS